jgi:putative tricarboxylic transport membrane protein
MKSETREVVSTLFWLIFAVFFCIGSFGASLGNFHRPGPGLFPFLCGAVLVLLSSVNLIVALRKKREITGEPELAKQPIKWRNIIIALVVLFAFPPLLDFIGLAPTLFIFFLVLLRFIEPQSWLVTLGGSAGGTVIVSLVFQVWLKIQFPKGIFGI